MRWLSLVVASSLMAVVLLCCSRLVSKVEEPLSGVGQARPIPWDCHIASRFSPRPNPVTEMI